MTIIGEILGFPEADRPQFREMVGDLMAIFEMQPTDEHMVAADAAQLSICDYFLKLIAEKRRKPGEDLLSNSLNRAASQSKFLSVTAGRLALCKT